MLGININSLQCTECDFGLYLIRFANNTSIDNRDSLVSMCIPKCEDFSYSYVSNPKTKTCECTQFKC